MCQSMNQYPIINDGLQLHFWKDIAIITDESALLSSNKNVNYEIGKEYTDLLALCNGINTIDTICENFSKDYGKNAGKKKDEALKMIKQMEEARIIIFKNKQSKEYIYWGERGKTYPIYLSIELTSRCNFSCPFCYKSALKEGVDIDSNIINDLYSLIGYKTRNIQFTGGEPFLNSKIDEYINLFEGHKISVVTNGSMLFSHADELLKKISLYQISMYGCNETEYFTNTHCTQGWNELTKSVKKLNQLGCDYHLSVVINNKNYRRIEDYICAAIKLGAKKIIFGTQTPVGRGMNGDTCMTIDDFRISYRLLKIAIRKYGEQINIEEWSHQGYNKDAENKEMTIKTYQGLFKCGSGTSHFVISQGGKVRPCELLPEKYFNLGGLEVIQRAINGNFMNESIINASISFSNELNEQGKKCSQFCEPLEILLNKHYK